MHKTFLSILLIVYSIAGWAQSVAGSGVVSGVVWETAESGLPDATVVLYNEAIGVRRVLQTSLDGIFEATGLPPASGYRLRVTRQRFAEWDSDMFSVPAGERLHFEIALAKADDKTISSVGRLLPAEQTTRTVSTSVEERQLDLLPAAQNRLDSLIPLAPATTTVPARGMVSIRGLTSFNAVLTDGLLAHNMYPARGAETGARAPVDAVQGMQVLVGGDTAEFGHAAGGTVNVVTRSGSNGLHGGAYEYVSNSGWNAIDRYAAGRNLFRKSNQPGVNLGGAIPGSHLFFFSNMEVYDAQGYGLNRILNPLIADSSGNAVASSNCKATAAQCAKAIRFIQDQMNVQVPHSEHTLNGLLRLDYRRSERNTVILSVDARHSRSPFGSSVNSVASEGGILGGALAKEDAHSARFAWLGAPSPRSVNEMGLGYFHDRVASSASNSALSTGKVSITVAGVTVGESHPEASVLRERRTQYVDNFRVSAGGHSVAFGIDWTRTRDWAGSLLNSAGAYSYPSLTAFAVDLAGSGQRNYNEFTQTFGTAARKLFSSEFGTYLQDSWLATPKLRVTGGIRWSKPFLPQPTTQNSAYYQTGTVNSPNVNADPRIGIAYRVGDRTVLRASFGMYHASHSGELLDALFLGNGVYQSNVLVNPSQSGAPIFPNIVASSSIPTGALNVTYAASKLRSPYTKQTTVEVARDLGHGIIVSASYLGSAALKLWTVEDRNLGSIQMVPYSVVDAAGRATAAFNLLTWTTRNNTDFAHVYEVGNGGSAWYRAGVLQVRKRLAHGFTANASYTWSHAIDDVGGPLVSGGIPLGSSSGDHLLDKGSSATDQRHRAAIDWSWVPRVGGDTPRPLRHLINGWEISSVMTFAAGQPQTAVVIVNGRQYQTPSTAFYASLNATGGWSRVPFLPVNQLYGESSRVINLEVARSIPFSERVSGRVAFEAFNAFNAQFDTRVQTIAYTATSSVLMGVPGVGTGVAATGFPGGSNARSCRLALRLTF